MRESSGFWLGGMLCIGIIASYALTSSPRPIPNSESLNPPRAINHQPPSSIRADFRLHPPLSGFLTCIDHWDGQLTELGDALGKDCFIQKMINRGGRIWLGAYKRDGYRNTDWYTYQADVLAPISGLVTDVSRSAGKNSPGTMGEGLASHVTIKRADGLHVMTAHMERIDVEEGDLVTRGQVIGNVGNNGFSRHPHLHIGAWVAGKAIPVDFDLKDMAALNPE